MSTSQLRGYSPSLGRVYQARSQRWLAGGGGAGGGWRWPAGLAVPVPVAGGGGKVAGVAMPGWGGGERSLSAPVLRRAVPSERSAFGAERLRSGAP
jgi:hypothetical protein